MKLTETYDRTRTKIVTEPHELYRFLASPVVEVTNLAFSSDDVVWLSWKLSDEERVPNLRYTNVVSVAYITAGARVHLYGFIDRLRENNIYCDTDSVILIQPGSEPWPIATGDKLGDMQSELKSSEHILEFVSGGTIIMHTG